MYSPGDVTELTGIPSSTLRLYVKRFKKHLSAHAKRKRRRRFTEADIAILTQARALMADGRKVADVSKALADVVADDTEAAIVQAPQIGRALADIRASYDELAAQITGMQASVTAEREATHDALSSMKAQLKYLTELEAWRALSWLERRRTPKPKPLE